MHWYSYGCISWYNTAVLHIVLLYMWPDFGKAASYTQG